MKLGAPIYYRIPKKNKTTFLLSLIISFILHFFVFKVFIDHHQKFENKYVSTKIKIMLREKQNQTRKSKFLSNETFIRKKLISENIKSKDNSVKVSKILNKNKDSIEEINHPLINNREINVLNFITNIELSDIFLGKNLFPRPYKACFSFLRGFDGQDWKIELTDFRPNTQPLSYLDQSVKNAFLKRLRLVDSSKLSSFLLKLNVIEKYSNSSGQINMVCINVKFDERG